MPAPKMPWEIPPILDDEVLSHYGTRDYFKDGPEYPDHFAISLLRGRLSPDEIVRIVTAGKRGAEPGDGVRWTVAGNLRGARFSVCPAPAKRNEDHVTVHFLGDWDDNTREAFVDCFEETVWSD